MNEMRQDKYRGYPMTAEKQRLKMIEDRLKAARHILIGIEPIWVQVDRRMKSLELEIKNLEDERVKLQQGQLTMNFEDLCF
jgi:hypothetical protein